MVFGYIYQMYHNNSRTCKEESICESMSINHQSDSLPSKSLCSSSANHSKEKENNNFGGNFYFIYALLGILYLATIAIGIICVCYGNRLNDLSVLRENLKNEFILTDIKHIVQMVLKDMKNDHQSLYKLSER